MTRGEIVRSNKWMGTRFYVGTAPYGKQFIVSAETFEETCKWFDKMEHNGWQSW